MKIFDGHIYNSKDVEYDYADPELWMSFTIKLKVAFDIAKGFPAYWDDMLGLGDDSQDATASIAWEHRCKILPNLAKESFPVKPFLKWSEFFPMQTFTKVDPKMVERLNRGDPLDFPCLDNPFYILHFLTKLSNPKYDPLSAGSWNAMASRLFHAFLRDSDRPRNDSAMERPSKLRYSIPGGGIFIRGQRFLNDQQALRFVYAPSAEKTIRWGPLCYASKTVFQSHFCVAGIQRSGKTTLLRLLFQSLHDQPEGSPRFVLFDAKPDLLPCLFPPDYFKTPRTDEEIESAFYLLNPFDRRRTAWDIAADASDSAQARDVADVLFPVEDPKRPHFAQTMRDLAVAVMDALREKTGGDNWTYYQLLAALQPQNISAVLSTTALGRDQLDTYLTGPHAAASDTKRTLRASTALCIPVAYAWHKAERRVSLRSWVKSDTKSIILGNYHGHPEAIKEVNRVLLNLLCNQLLAVKNKPARTFLYLDEFERLGHIDTLPVVTLQGASRGVNLAVCFHDLDLLKEVYGRAAEGILSQCGFYAFLKLQGRESTKWASDMIGSQEVKLEQTSEQSHSQGEGEESRSSKASSFHQVTRRLVLPDEISALPTPESANALEGYFVGPGHPRYKGRIPATVVGGKDDSPDGDSADYALWPRSSRIEEFAESTTDLTPPSDMFKTLYDIGFKKEGYEPPADEPEQSAVEDAEPQVGEPINEPPSEKPKPKLRRHKDISFDFGLDD